MQAPNTAELFNSPTLRPGVEIQENEDGIALVYRDQSCDINIDGNAKASLLSVIHSLKHPPASILALRMAHASIADSIDPLLRPLHNPSKI